MFKCKLCNKTFKTLLSQQQHVGSAKHLVKPPQAFRTKRSTGRRRRGRNGNAGVDVAPSRARAAPASSIVLSGEDRIDSFTVTNASSLFYSVPITAGLSLRLSNVAKAFQRISWLGCTVRVIPQAPLTTKGGYVAGFVMDPSDKAVTAAELTAAQGSKTCKWYETCVSSMPSKRQLLYTSAGEDPRLSSPGTFWVVSEGNPADNITVIVTINWRVRLSYPMVENVSDNSFMLEGSIVPKSGGYNLLYRPPGKKYEEARDDVSVALPENLRTQDCVFRVPTFLIEYAEGTGDTGSRQMHFVHYVAAQKRFFYSSTGDQIESDIVWQSGVTTDTTLVPCNTFMKYLGAKNCMQSLARDQQSSQSRDSQNFLKALQDLKNTFQTSLLLSNRGSRESIGRSSRLTQSYETLHLP